ncbi:hypothetical protein [Pantoea sp. BAV 3049]|uniref:hypothetical protein n=1 Tax=Pantoea sp. BAV 3049 TaxID=2654188 RepID=UPI00131C16CA|nr:hypothetical protein [Pantoea sp. BAV 3049]
MIITPNSTIIGGEQTGLIIPGALVLGDKKTAAMQYIFIQNDTYFISIQLPAMELVSK